MKLISLLKFGAILSMAFVLIDSLKHGHENHLNKHSNTNVQTQQPADNHHTMNIPTLRTSLF